MDNPEVMAKRKERMQTIVVLSPFVFLLIWNAVFFYTDWWETYLKPIGLHTWLDSLHWLRPIYDGLETRIYQHNADAQKFMVLLSWGIATGIFIGLLLSVITFKSTFIAFNLEYKKRLRNDRLKLIVGLAVSMLVMVLATEALLTNYGDSSSSRIGKFFDEPTFMSLYFFQCMYLSATWLLLIFLPTTISFLYLELSKKR